MITRKNKNWTTVDINVFEYSVEFSPANTYKLSE